MLLYTNHVYWQVTMLPSVSTDMVYQECYCMFNSCSAYYYMHKYTIAFQAKVKVGKVAYGFQLLFPGHHKYLQELS